MEVVTISPHEDGFRLAGVVYTLDGKTVAHFESQFATMNWPILYNQIIDSDNRFDRRREGLAHMHFQAGPFLPIQLNGFFGHVGLTDLHSLEGIKIPKQADIRALFDPKTRKKKLDEYFSILNGDAPATLNDVSG